VTKSVTHGELVADGRDGDVFEEMALEGRDLLWRGEPTTFAVHDGTSFRLD
jgi:hypothetical protein